jgi:hypothetical protein
MTDSNRQSDEAKVTARLKELLKGISTFIDDASREQKRTLLMALEELQPSARSKLSAWLKDFLEEDDFSQEIEEATADQKRRLLVLLEDLRASDRRRHPRIPCSIAVALDGFFTDVIRNISVGGVFIETSEAFQPGKALELEFSLPNQEQRFKVIGKIAWRSPEGIGVSFTAVSEELRRILESFSRPLFGA